MYLSPLYLGLHGFLLYWILKWLSSFGKGMQKKKSKVLVSLIFSFLAFSPLIGFYMPGGCGRRVMKQIGNYWLGVLLYLTLAVFVSVTAGLIGKYLRRKATASGKECRRTHLTMTSGGTICALVVLGISLWGSIHAGILHVTPYEFTVNKDGGKLEKLKIVLIADLHLGYNMGIGRMERTVTKINEQEPDLVVIAGDIFDNEYEAIEEPDKMAALFRDIHTKYGVYACYGNHDTEEPVLAGFTFSGGEKKTVSAAMDRFLEKAGIQLLSDEGVLIEDSVWLYGRPDRSLFYRSGENRRTPAQIMESLGTDKPVIIIDHQPAQLQELADAGADVDLCGHTHAGQMFPGNLIVSKIWENAYGYLKKGTLHNIVTSGAGVFGPNMRVGTKSEICPITIHFS